jgi:ribulose-phosphate 3-epimerase
MGFSARDLIARAPTLSVGIVSADLLHLGDECATLERAGIDVLHVDVMDGVFCPGISVGLPFVKALPGSFVKDVHLMVTEPLRSIERYVEAGAGIVTFHVEATAHAYRGLQMLAGSGVLRGIALNPGTLLETVDPLLDELELVLLLAVNPGWGGQSFIESTRRRIQEIRTRLEGREIVLAVDGGITRENVAGVAAAGVDVVVTGSAVFAGGDTAGNAAAIQHALANAGRVGAELRS